MDPIAGSHSVDLGTCSFWDLPSEMGCVGVHLSLSPSGHLVSWQHCREEQVIAWPN